MKTSKIVFILALTFLGFASKNEVKSQEVSINFSTFQNELSPYGRWINSPRYGQVWSYNETGFQPYYTNGHWEYTDEGWYWASDYDWGWATFHYGRWELDPMYGWVWIPGYDYAPAWVAWSENSDYYGWAPLGYGLGLNISFNSIPMNRWMFTPRQYITSRNIYQYGIPGNRNRNFRNVTIINAGRNDRYMRGPDRYEVQRYTHQSIEPRHIDNNYGRYGNNAGNSDRYRGNTTIDRRQFDNRVNINNGRYGNTDQNRRTEQDRRVDNTPPTNNTYGRTDRSTQWNETNTNPGQRSSGRYGNGSVPNQVPQRETPVNQPPTRTYDQRSTTPTFGDGRTPRYGGQQSREQNTNNQTPQRSYGGSRQAPQPTGQPSAPVQPQSRGVERQAQPQQQGGDNTNHGRYGRRD